MKRIGALQYKNGATIYIKSLVRTSNKNRLNSDRSAPPLRSPGTKNKTSLSSVCLAATHSATVFCQVCQNTERPWMSETRCAPCIGCVEIKALLYAHLVWALRRLSEDNRCSSRGRPSVTLCNCKTNKAALISICPETTYWVLYYTKVSSIQSGCKDTTKMYTDVVFQNFILHSTLISGTKHDY